ncbi:MAG: TonB-dependent receptor plug domain-containing protein [Pseudomonadales bacterium]|nr:TonB-dependent receptor plug domain-containing protein [Pseudomonadales bacterium]
MVSKFKNKPNLLYRLPNMVAAMGVLATAATVPAYAEDSKSRLTIEEVIVTARKREESVQDTPIAVSAFTGDGLEIRGVTDLSSLDNFSPNLVLNRSPSNSGVTNAAIYIRGIGQNDFSPVIDPGVGIYVDGVYLGRSVGGILDLVDLERVEVLRGPQGTLFGKNTIGGAVSLTSKRPSEEFGGKVGVKLGTDNRLNLSGTLDVPISDQLLTRISLASFNQDGHVDRVFDGKDLGDDDTIAAKFTALWLANDNLEVNFSFDYSKDDENGPALVTTGMEPINSGFFGPGGAPSMTLAQNTLAAQLAEPGGIAPGGTFFDPAAAGLPFNFGACFEQANLNNPEYQACFCSI